MKVENFKNQTLEVYVCDQIRYISKADFIKYVKKQPKTIETSGDIEIVPIAQEEIDKICLIHCLRAQLNILKSRERENENTHQSQKRFAEVNVLKYKNCPGSPVVEDVELEADF